MLTDRFAVKFIRKTREDRRPIHNFKLYVIHPTSSEVHFTREGMVFPAPVVDEIFGFMISKVKTITRVNRVFIGNADLDFKKLFPADEGQNLDFTVTSPGFIGYAYNRGDIPISKLIEAYVQGVNGDYVNSNS